MRVKISKEELLRHIKLENVGASLIKTDISGPDFIELDAEVVDGVQGIGRAGPYHFNSTAPNLTTTSKPVEECGVCFGECKGHAWEKQKECCKSCLSKRETTPDGMAMRCMWAECPCHKKVEIPADFCDCLKCKKDNETVLTRPKIERIGPLLDSHTEPTDFQKQVRAKLNEIIDYVNKEV